MDTSSIAAASVGAQSSQARMDVATQVVKQAAQQEQDVAKMVDEAAQNAERLANVKAGVGRALDISV
ncbi:hypothetical protein [Rhodovulum sp. PH10]|uniref:hypothetical protein n=1 Tax=Rhodovulum sp. PH10 TaxID=1187851 RepID=UPI0012FC0CE9|nr:hypothetical protein [Rhodovulum sp. PH10]